MFMGDRRDGSRSPLDYDKDMIRPIYTPGRSPGTSIPHSTPRERLTFRDSETDEPSLHVSRVIASPRVNKPSVPRASPATLAYRELLKKEREQKNHVVESITECVVRVKEQPDQQTLAREVRLHSVQILSEDTFVDTCLVWFLHLLIAEQLLLLTSYHGMHDLDWHLGPSLKTKNMLRNDRIEVIYWLIGVVTLMGMLFGLPVSMFASSCDKFGREVALYVFSHRSGLFTVSLFANPGVVISSVLLLVFHLPCCANFRTSDTRAFLVFFPVTFAIGMYFAWGAMEVNRAKKGSDIAFLRYKLFPVDTVALIFVKAALFVLTELMIIFKIEKIYDIPWIHVISPLLTMLGIVLVESLVRSAWPYKCFKIKMQHQLDLVAIIDATCLATGAALLAYRLDHPTWRPWNKTIAVPFVTLFVLHSLWLILDTFRRFYSSPAPRPNYLTWLEPVVIGLDMDEELHYFEANITWASPTADDKLGEFERFEVEMAQIPFSKDPNDDNITFEVTDASDLEWISVYSGPNIEITVSNLEALSMFVLRVHGKKTANGAGYTGPIRKMTSPAMTAAVTRTKAGALSPLQHVLQVQNAKIKALRSVVKRLQEDRAPGRPEQESRRSNKCLLASSPEKVNIDFLSKLSDKHPDLTETGRSSPAASQPRSILPSVRQAQDIAERESHLKNQFHWRRLADVQIIQATSEPESTTRGGSLPPSGGSPPKSLAQAWNPESHAHSSALLPGLRNPFVHQEMPRVRNSPTNTHQQSHSISNLRDYPMEPITTIRVTLGLDHQSIGGDGSAQRVAFRNVLQQDFANASGLPPSCFMIKRLSVGSVIVHCDIHQDPAKRGPEPMSVALDFQLQVRNADSLLLAGSLTRYATDVAISPGQCTRPSDLNHSMYSPRTSVHRGNAVPERAGNSTASPTHPPSSIISFKPLGKLFGPGLRDFESDLHLEISTSYPVRSLYYTLNGSTPSIENFDGSGTPPLTIKLNRTTVVNAMYITEDGRCSGMRSEVYVLNVARLSCSHSPNSYKGENLEEWRAKNALTAGARSRSPSHSFYDLRPPDIQSSPTTISSPVSLDSITKGSTHCAGGVLAYPNARDNLAKKIPGGAGVPSTPDNFSQNIKTGSIGLLLEQHNVTRRVFVKSLMPGGPAHRDGRLREGDRLITVDGYTVQGLDLSIVFDMIKGIPGTKAKLLIQRDQNSWRDSPSSTLPTSDLPSLSPGSPAESSRSSARSGSKTTLVKIDIERKFLAATPKSRKKSTPSHT